MDISCIISSGDIELYVMGLLPAEEARQMEQLIALFPEIREEADRVSEALQRVAERGTAMPAPELKDRLFAQLAKEESTNVNPAISRVPNDGQNGASPAPVVAMPQRKNYSLAAAVVVAIISLAGLVYALSESARNKKQTAALNQKVKAAKDAEQRAAIAYANLLSIAADTNYKQVDLTSLKDKPASFARIFWNKHTKDVYLVDVSLPQAPAGKQYQLWAIVGEKPIDAGLVSGDRSVIQKMNSFDKAGAFAITLEKEGGSPTPTLEELYVMGATTN